MRNDAGRTALKTATKALVLSLGGFDAAETVCDRSTARLHGYTDFTAMGRFVPVDVLLDLEAVAPAPRVTAMLAALAGYRLVRQPAAGGAPLRALAELLRSSGMATATAADAMADGQVSAAESLALLPVLEQLATLAAAAHATLSQAHPEE
jgi:hypothetical protein